jgi:hypothetical protein
MLIMTFLKIKINKIMTFLKIKINKIMAFLKIKIMALFIIGCIIQLMVI